MPGGIDPRNFTGRVRHETHPRQRFLSGGRASIFLGQRSLRREVFSATPRSTHLQRIIRALASIRNLRLGCGWNRRSAGFLARAAHGPPGSCRMFLAAAGGGSVEESQLPNSIKLLGGRRGCGVSVPSVLVNSSVTLDRAGLPDSREDCRPFPADQCGAFDVCPSRLHYRLVACLADVVAASGRNTARGGGSAIFMKVCAFRLKA
jgi:hypothetical protein